MSRVCGILSMSFAWRFAAAAQRIQVTCSTSWQFRPVRHSFAQGFQVCKVSPLNCQDFTSNAKVTGVSHRVTVGSVFTNDWKQFTSLQIPAGVNLSFMCAALFVSTVSPGLTLASLERNRDNVDDTFSILPGS